MKCVMCKVGNTSRGKTEVVLRRRGTTMIFRDVPADVCDSCGEYYLDGDVAAMLQQMADAAEKRGTELEILRYAA